MGTLVEKRYISKAPKRVRIRPAAPLRPVRVFPRIPATDMTPPLITILLPTFHRRDFLPAAIRSIHDQSFANWRLLVLNDGGEDVADIVAGFGDPRI